MAFILPLLACLEDDPQEPPDFFITNLSLDHYTNMSRGNIRGFILVKEKGENE